MPPKGSQKPAPTSSQIANLTAAFNKLSEHLQKAWKTEGEIEAPVALNKLKELLRTQRQKSTTIEPSFVIEIVSSLQKEGEDLCSRIDDSIFSAIVEAILQTDYCIENERGLFLLADSLRRDRKGTANGKGILRRKDAIGKAILQPALSYFVDKQNPSEVRRWIGILCAQLLLDSPANASRLGLGSDKTRKKIGTLIIEEKNEVIRSICGKLMRAVTKDDEVAAKSFFPDKSDERLSEKFPRGRQNDDGWSQQFNQYIDNLVEGEVIPHQDDISVYFGSSCRLIPAHRFGVETSHVNIMVDEKIEWITILSPSSADSIEHIIDIPVGSISQFVVLFQEHSQETIAQLLIRLDNNEDTFCYLNGEGIKLEGTDMLLAPPVILELTKCIRFVRPDLEPIEEYVAPVEDGGEGHLESQKSSTAEDAIVLDTGELEEFQRKGTSHGEILPSKVNPESQVDSESSSAIEVINVEGDKDRTTENRHVDEDIYDASPQHKKARPANNEMVEEQEEEHALSPQKNAKETILSKSNLRKRKSVKRVAKTPIKTGQRQNGNGNAVENRSMKQAESKNTATVKEQPKLPTAAKLGNPEASAADSEPLSNPESNDASTPKVQSREERDDGDFIPSNNGTRAAANIGQTRSKKQVATARAKAPMKATSRQSLSQKAEEEALYEIPIDDDDEEPVQGKRKSKAPAKTVAKAQKTSSQTKKAALKAKADLKKRKSAPAVIENVAPAEAEAIVHARESESMPPPPKLHDKKRQSLPAKMPLQESRVTRGSTTSQVPAAKSQPPNARAKAITRAAGAQSQQLADHPSVQQEESPTPVDDEDFNSFHILEDVVKETPSKDNSRPIAAPKKNKDNGRKSLAKDAGSDIADKLSGIFDDLDTDEVVAKSSPFTSADPRPKKQALANHSNLADDDIDELGELHLNLAAGDVYLPARTDAKSTFKVPEKPARRVNKRGSGEVIKGKPIEYQAQATPAIESSTPVPQGGNSSDLRKRKAPMNESTPSKRPRPDGVDTLANQTPSPRRSPRIAAKSRKVNQKPSPMQQQESLNSIGVEGTNVGLSPVLPKTRGSGSRVQTRDESQVVEAAALTHRSSHKPKKSSPLAVQSPKSRAGLQKNNEDIENGKSKTPLVNDRLSRKPAVISFNKHGALNQGVSSTPRESLGRSTPVELPTKKLSIESKREKPGIQDNPIPLTGSGGKRKRERERADLKGASGPPKKRKNVSPPEQDVDEASDENDDVIYGSSPPEPNHKPVRATGAHPRLARQSSQLSRVDHNGSPQASPGSVIDHIGKAKQKLLDQSVDAEELEEVEQHTPVAKERRISDAFGPRIRLSSQAKTRPASPAQSQPRYVAHKKMNGHYEEINSKEVILPQEKLPDPFVEKTQRSSGFSERLKARPVAIDSPQRDEGQKKVAVRGGKGGHKKAVVAADSRLRVEEAAPSLSSGSTGASGSSQASRTPLQEMEAQDVWHMAVRPHYATLSQAVHRIADEVLIRLADEEDRMGLMVSEYKENGIKILDTMAQKRANEKSQMLHDLEEKKSVMVTAYTAAMESMSKTARKLQQQPLERIEKDWSKKQEMIREKMGGAEQSSEVE